MSYFLTFICGVMTLIALFWRYHASCVIRHSHFCCTGRRNGISDVLGVGQLWSQSAWLLVADVSLSISVLRSFLKVVATGFLFYIVWWILLMCLVSRCLIFRIWVFVWRFYGHSVTWFKRSWLCSFGINVIGLFSVCLTL